MTMANVRARKMRHGKGKNPSVRARKMRHGKGKNPSVRARKMRHGKGKNPSHKHTIGSLSIANTSEKEHQGNSHSNLSQEVPLPISMLPPATLPSSLHASSEEEVPKNKSSPLLQMVKKIKESLQIKADPHEELLSDLEQEKEKQESSNSESGDDGANNGNEAAESTTEDRGASKLGAMGNQPMQDIFNMKIEIDRLKAQTAALNDSRKVVNEHFLKVAEDTGSLRANVLTLEKELRDIVVRVSRAIDLVETVQPQKLYSEIKHHDAKIEAFDGKLETNKERTDKIMNELKDIRSKLSFVKGVEQIVKITEEVGDELKNITKTKSLVEQHADKMESMYLEIKSKFSKFEEFESIGKEVQESATTALGDLEKIRAKADSFLTKDQLEAIKVENEQAMETVLNSMNGIKGNVAEISNQLAELKKSQEEIPLRDLQEGLSLLSKKIEDVKKNSGDGKTAQLVRDMGSFQKKLEDRIAKELGDHYEYVEERSDQMEKSIKELKSSQATLVLESAKHGATQISKIRQESSKFQIEISGKLRLMQVEIGKFQKEMAKGEQHLSGNFSTEAKIEKKMRAMQQEHHEMMAVVLQDLNLLKREMAGFYNAPPIKGKKASKLPLPKSTPSTNAVSSSAFYPKVLSKGLTPDKLKTLYG